MVVAIFRDLFIGQRRPMRRTVAIIAILLSFPAAAQLLNDVNTRPYMTFKILVDGAEVPVTREGEGTYCDGESCGFTAPNITFGRSITIKFIPKVKADELGIRNFNGLDGIASLTIEGASLQNLANTSPDDWLGRGPNDPFDPGDRAGVEWTADLIPTRVADQDFVEVKVRSVGSGWRTWQSRTASYENLLTFRVVEPTPVSVTPLLGLWLLAGLMGLLGIRRFSK
jgi:hypothetical protein